MTRHNFQHEGVQWVVGWDEATATYFAQRETGERELEDITGTHVGQHTRVRSMLDELRDQVTIPDEVSAQLHRDAPAFTEPTVQLAQLVHDSLTAELKRAADHPCNTPTPPGQGAQR